MVYLNKIFLTDALVIVVVWFFPFCNGYILRILLKILISDYLKVSKFYKCFS